MRTVEIRRIQAVAGKPQEVPPLIGKFHQWGVDYEEFENGPGNFSVAIVELPDGTVNTFVACHVKFLD